MGEGQQVANLQSVEPAAGVDGFARHEDDGVVVPVDLEAADVAELVSGGVVVVVVADVTAGAAGVKAAAFVVVAFANAWVVANEETADAVGLWAAVTDIAFAAGEHTGAAGAANEAAVTAADGNLAVAAAAALVAAENFVSDTADLQKDYLRGLQRFHYWCCQKHFQDRALVITYSLTLLFELQDLLN